MQDNLVIRLAKEQDLDSVYDMVCKLQEKEFVKKNFQEIYINNLSSQSIYYIVAEYNNKIVGFISLHIQKLLHHAGNAAEIQELFVDSTLHSITATF